MIRRDTVQHVARLAELSLRDDEIETLTRDLAAIVAYVEQLSAVDTEGIAPGRAASGLAGWRADEPSRGLTRDEALAEAPHPTADGFGVPPFLKRR